VEAAKSSPAIFIPSEVSATCFFSRVETRISNVEFGATGELHKKKKKKRSYSNFYKFYF